MKKYLIFYLFFNIFNQKLITSELIFLDSEQYPKITYDFFFKTFFSDALFNYYSVGDVISGKSLENKICDILCINITTDFLKSSPAENSKLFLKQIKKVLELPESFENKHKKVYLFLPSMSQSEENSFQKILTPLWLALGLKILTRKDILLIEVFLLKSLRKVFGFQTSLFPKSKTLDNNIELFMPLKPLNSNSKTEVFLVKKELLFWKSILENFSLQPVLKSNEKKLDNFILEKTSSIFPKNNIQETNMLTIKKINHKTFAWLEIPQQREFKNDAEKIIYLEELNSLVSIIAKSKLDGIWLTPAINEYFSSRGKHAPAKKFFKRSLLAFFKELLKVTNNRPPKIFFSTEIANNFVGDICFTTENKSLWGSVAKDIPAPLDFSFWNDEVLKPWVEVVKYIEEKKIINNYGLIIDLEMYLRKSTSVFNSASGFNEYLKEEFCDLSKIDFTSFSSNLPDYFNFLEEKAFNLGLEIKKQLNFNFKNKEIGVYLPTFIPNWFYLGFLRGLSDKESKILFLSFSINLSSWEHWLKSQKINLNIYEVFMLSKLNDQNWKKILLQQQQKPCSGMWLNRFSWLPKKYEADHWAELERPKNKRPGDKLVELLGSRKRQRL